MTQAISRDEALSKQPDQLVLTPRMREDLRRMLQKPLLWAPSPLLGSLFSWDTVATQPPVGDDDWLDAIACDRAGFGLNLDGTDISVLGIWSW